MVTACGAGVEPPDGPAADSDIGTVVSPGRFRSKAAARLKRRRLNLLAGSDSRSELSRPSSTSYRPPAFARKVAVEPETVCVSAPASTAIPTTVGTLPRDTRLVAPEASPVGPI